MMPNGYFKAPRSIVDVEWYAQASPLTRSLWFLLMSLANYMPGRTKRGEAITPGQLVTSWASLAEQLAWNEHGARIVPTRSKVRRAADFLKTAGEVTWKATGVAAGSGIIVTLERWALYASASSDAAQD